MFKVDPTPAQSEKLRVGRFEGKPRAGTVNKALWALTRLQWHLSPWLWAGAAARRTPGALSRWGRGAGASENAGSVRLTPGRGSSWGRPSAAWSCAWGRGGGGEWRTKSRDGLGGVRLALPELPKLPRVLGPVSPSPPRGHVLPCSVAQPCPLFCDPVDESPPGSSALGVSQQESWRGLPFPSGDLPDPGIDPAAPGSPTWQADSLPLSHLGRPLGPQAFPKWFAFWPPIRRWGGLRLQRPGTPRYLHHSFLSKWTKGSHGGWTKMGRDQSLWTWCGKCVFDNTQRK